MRTIALRTLLVAILLGTWEFAVRTALVSPLLVAAPSQIPAAMADLARDPEIRHAFFQAVGSMLAAFVLAAAAGTVGGVVLGRVAWVHAALHPVLVLLNSTPKLIFLPIVLLVFGIGNTAVVVYGANSAVFSVLIVVAAGVRQVGERWNAPARALGISRAQMLRHVILPASLPSIFTALWSALQHALLGVLVVELFVSQHGIGYFVSLYTATFQASSVYALMFGLAFVTVTLALALRSLEQRVTRWQRAGAG